LEPLTVYIAIQNIYNIICYIVYCGTVDNYETLEHLNRSPNIEQGVFSSGDQEIFVQNWEDAYETVWYSDTDPLDFLDAANLAYPIKKGVDCTIESSDYQAFPRARDLKEYIQDHGLEDCEKIILEYSEEFNLAWENEGEVRTERDGDKVHEISVYSEQPDPGPFQNIYSQIPYSELEERRQDILLSEVTNYLSQDNLPDTYRETI